MWVAAFVLGALIYGAGREVRKWYRAFRKRLPGLRCERCGERATSGNPVRSTPAEPELVCATCRGTRWFQRRTATGLATNN